jgi:hypothetical protein
MIETCVHLASGLEKTTQSHGHWLPWGPAQRVARCRGVWCLCPWERQAVGTQGNSLESCATDAGGAPHAQERFSGEGQVDRDAWPVSRPNAGFQALG